MGLFSRRGRAELITDLRPGEIFVFAENRWGKRSRLVYFFPQRPTRQQALGQTLSGRRRPRYLYELEVLSPFDAVYERVAARATTEDLTARVVRRQPAPAWSRRRL